MTTTIEGADEFIAKAMSDLTANLAFIRKKRAVTYRELGLRAGMTERNAYMVVTGKQSARDRTIAQLAWALKVPIGDLHLDSKKFSEKYKAAKPLPPFVLSTEAMREYVGTAA